MKFIDSNVLAFAFYDNENKERCRNLVLEGGLINTVCLIEAFNIIEAETKSPEFAVRAIRSLLKANLEIIDVDINLIFEALKKREKYNSLKFLDLVHYISARLNNCEEIASYDSDFDDLEIKRVTGI